MLTKINLILTTALLTLSIRAYSQIQDISFSHIDTDNGLASDNVRCMLQDEKGFIWITTVKGLNRYDGTSFDIFKKRLYDTTSLSSNIFGLLVEDIKRNIWIIIDGISYQDLFSPSKEIRIPFPPLEEIARNDIKQHLDTPAIVFQIKSTNGKNPIFGYGRETPYSILELKNKDVWIASPDGIRIFNPATNTIRPFLGDASHDPKIFKHAKVLHEDEDGAIWLNTQLGIQKWNVDNQTLETIFPNVTLDYYQCMFQILFTEEEIYVCSEGLKVYDKKTKQIKHYQADLYALNRLSSNNTTCLMQDDLGRIWIGTADAGINIIDPYKPQVYNYQPNPADKDFLATKSIDFINEDSEGWVWLSSGGGWYYRYDPKTGTMERYFSGYAVQWLNQSSSKYAPSWHKDVVVQGRPANTKFFDKKNKKIIDFIPEAICNQFPKYTLPVPFIDSRGDKYFKPHHRFLVYENEIGGLIRVEAKTGKITHHRAHPENPDSLLSQYVTDILETQDSTLWIALWGGLTHYYPDSKKFVQYLHDPNNPNTISSPIVGNQGIYEDKQGNIWIPHTIAGGLDMIPAYAARKDSNVIIRYNSYNTDLADDRVAGVVEDKAGNLWAGTYAGLYKFDKKNNNFLSVPLTEDKKIDYAAGFITLTTAGRIYMGTSNEGFFTFDPMKIKPNTTPPKVHINDFQINNMPVPIRGQKGDTLAWESPLELSILYTDSIKLNYGQNEFSFSFVALNYTYPERTRYKYKLENFDKDWNETDNKKPFAYYTNVPPGEYTFHVIGSNNDGVWNEEGDTLHIVILPAWWQTWWAYLLYTVLALVILYSFYRYQLGKQLAKAETKRLLELDTFRTTLYTNITHEFRTPLTVILGLADEIQQGYQKHAATIKRNGKQLLQLVDQMLALSKLESGKEQVKWQQGDIIAFSRYVVESFQSFAAAKGIQLAISSEIEALSMDYDAEKLQLILSNLIANAIKFTPTQGQIKVTLAQHKQQFHITISDTGEGIAPAQLPFIFDRYYQADSILENTGSGIGLTLVKEYIQMLAGEIKVESELDKGTTFQIQLPIRQQAAKTTIKQPPSKPEPQPPLEPEPASEPQSNSNPKLLLVEDNKDVLNYLSLFLQAKYELHYAYDGAEGIRKAIGEVPDLIICDVMMPKKNGYELCAQIKKDERTSHIPIILLTAKADFESKMIGLQEGADVYLSKPFSKQELLVQIQRLIEQRKALQAHYSLLATLPTKQYQVSDKEASFLHKLQSLIEARIEEENFDIAEICKTIGISRNHLARKIKALTGKTTSEYVHGIRLQRAKDFLVNTDWSIAEIAYKVGFNSVAYFSSTFAAYFEQSPSAYRKSNT